MPASYPTSVKSFTTKVNGVDAPDAEHINDLQLEVEAVETELLDGMVDYSAISTITGWSSFTTKKIYYKKIGKMVFVSFDLRGTSNSTVSNFTLPFISVNNGLKVTSVCQIMDNGTLAFGMQEIQPNTSNVGIFPSASGGNWVASGDKYCIGQLWFVSQ